MPSAPKPPQEPEGPRTLPLGPILAVAAFALAGWAVVRAGDAAIDNNWADAALWAGMAHVASAVAVFFGRHAGWVRLVYFAALAVVGLTLGYAIFEAGWSRIDKTSMHLLVFSTALPPALRSAVTGGLSPVSVEMVNDSIRQRSTPIRIAAAVVLFSGLAAWIVFDLALLVAVALAASVALGLVGMWLAAVGAQARSELAS